MLFVTLILDGQENIQSILTTGNNFDLMTQLADSYFETKHPNLTKKQLTRGLHRDGEFVKYMRWKSFWQDGLNPDGTLGDFANNQEAIFNRSLSSSLYEDVEWSNISNTEFITLQISMGRTSSMAFHPTDTDIFYVGADIGGIWKTEDGGKSYTAIGDNLPYLAVSSIIVDQENPDILYLSLGSHLWNGLPSIGVYKSTDAGETWAPTSLIFPTSQNTRINWMAADPENSNIILIASNSGLYKSTDGLNTFTQISTGNFAQVHYKTDDNNIVYLSTNDGQFLKSINGGNNFTLVRDFGNNVVSIALAALEPNKVVLTHGLTLHVSKDAGESFPEAQDLPETFNGQVAVINPQNTNDYIAGYFDLYRSTNGGANFTKISDWLGRNGLPVIHVDMRNCFVNPLQNDRVYFCHDGGVDAYNFATEEFINLSDGLIITQFYDIGVSQTNENVVSGGSQDNGSMYRDRNGVWDDLAGTGDGMISEIDPTNENLIYWEFQFGAMRRFDGLATTNISPPNEDGEGAWITPYRLDPSNPNRIIAGYKNVYESLNQGTTWSVISGELANGVNLDHIAIAENIGERIYAINSNNLYVKSVESDTWTRKSLPTSGITDIEVNPLDMNKIMITVGGYSSGSKVYASDDAGDNWVNISGNLPNVVFGALEYYRDIENAVFIGSEAGVFYRDDSSSEWLAYGNLPNTRIRDIEIQYSSQKVRVGTFGRGVFEADIDIVACDKNSSDQDNDGVCDVFDICPNFADSMIGAVCDDGDLLSSNETISENCICEGGESNLVYCSAEGSAGTGSDFIDLVQVNDLFNSSGKTNYSDFRNISTTLIEDSTYTITISLGFSFAQDKSFGWIDYDRSGTFDEDEVILMSTFDENHTSSASFRVPDLEEYGATTMRVRSVFGSNLTANPCGSIFGEVEDYTIQLKNAQSALVDVDQDGFLNDVDCDDNNPNVNPDQVEIAYNGIDDDCNSDTLDDDFDEDGFLLVDDCDDTNPSINPDAIEIPNNGIDEDCDGEDVLTSTHELAKATVTIYPNPASKVINIVVNGQLNFEANLYDLSGRRIETYKNTKQIQVSTISSGAYILEILDINSNQKIIEQIIIEK